MSRIFYNKKSGKPIQVLLKAKAKPSLQEVICYQELTKPYEYFVMGKKQFLAEYVQEKAGTSNKNISEKKVIEKSKDVQPKVSDKSESVKTVESNKPVDSNDTVDNQSEEEMDEKMKLLISFFDEKSIRSKLQILIDHRDEFDEHMLNNMAASLDVVIDDGRDAYDTLYSELTIKAKYEKD